MRCGICGDWMASGRRCFRCVGGADLERQWLPPTLPLAETPAEVAAEASSPALRQELAIDRRSRPRTEATANDPMQAESPRSDWAAEWEDRWSEGLAAAYQEVAAEKPSGVLQACIDRLAGSDGREDISVAGSVAAATAPAGGRDLGVTLYEGLEASLLGEEPVLSWEKSPLEVEPSGMTAEMGALEEESFDVQADRWGMIRMQLVAGAVDAALLAPLVASVSWVAGPGSASIAFGGIAAFCYLTLSGILGGRTLGDRVVGLQTIDHRSGERPSLGRVALRAVVGVIGTAALLIGPLWSVFDAESRTLHDRLAGTTTLPVA